MTSNSFVSQPRHGAPPFRIVCAVTTIQLIPAIARAHGVVGNRIFLSPIVGDDAFPDNALSFTIRRSDFQLSLVPEIKEQLIENSSIL